MDRATELRIGLRNANHVWDFRANNDLAEAKSGSWRFYPHKNFPACAEVTVSGQEFPKTIIIDYGEDCFNRWGNQKTGVITITISDAMINEGAVYEVNFDNVTFGRRSINKTSTVTNEGINDNGNWVISYVSLSTVSYGDSLVVERDFIQEKEWINGFGTRDPFDDQFFKTGGGTITVNKDLVFERNIIDALHIDRACRFILSGVVEISKGDESMTIDYGEGDCDNIAIVTKDGISEEIELSKCRFRDGFMKRHRHFYRLKGWW